MEEMRVLLRNSGKIDPRNAKEYIKAGGYEGMKKALSMSGSEIINELQEAGLRGRGGAGFPTWRKLKFAYDADGDIKYIVCNADEGEPGTNKDRILLSTDPCSVFEGMIIAGKAVDSHVGFIYLRAEYSYLVPILEAALESSRSAGCLGKISWEVVLILTLSFARERAHTYAVRKPHCLNLSRENEENHVSDHRSRE